MLDNLSLGFSGTKEGMEELLARASELSGQEYDIGNLNDVYDAIHVIQEDLKVTETTAKEGEKTLSGSFAAMKASADNFLGNLSVRPELIGQSMQELVSSVNTFLFKNLIPAIGNVIKALPTAISTFIKQGIPQLMSSGKQLLDSILDGMGNFDIMGTVLPMLEGLSKKILDSSGGMVDAGLGILTKLAEGIAKGLPKLIKYMPKIIGNLADVINKNAPKIIKGAAKIMLILGKGLLKSIPVLIKNIPNIFKAFLKVWEALNWLNLGKIAITGIKKGITSLTKNLSEPVKKAFNQVKNAILAPSNAAKNALSGIVSAIKGKINFAGIAGKVKSAFSKVKDTITSPFTKAKQSIKTVIDKIKELFPFNLGKIIKMKLPKITLTTGSKTFFGKEIKYPTGWNLTWKSHAKAMDNPYMFSGATIFGAGEAGDEILYGHNTLMQDITKAVTAATAVGSGSSGGTVSLVINLDGRTIAQNTIDYVNDQTIMFGTSPIIA